MPVPDPNPARRGDVVDTIHGRTVADPYRWMEDLDDPALTDWVDAMADEATAALAALPGRQRLRETLAAATDVPRGGAPWRRGSWWFQLRNEGLQDHDVLWCVPATSSDGHGPDPSAPAPTDGWRVLVDPAGFEGAGSLGPVAASPTGALLAYAVSESGSDWQTWRIRDVRSGDDLPDRVPWSKFTGASWLPDGTGFVTCTYEPPPPGEQHETAQRDQRVVRHVVGGTTTVVHARPDQPELGFDPVVSHDGRWVVLVVDRGTDPETRVHVVPLGEDGALGEVVRLLDDADAAWHPIGVVGDELWCRTDLDAPLGRVVAVALDGSGVQREVLAESPDQLEEAHLVGAARPGAPGWLTTVHLVHAASVVGVRPLRADGTIGDATQVDVGDLVTVGGRLAPGAVTGSREDRLLHLRATGFDEPAALHRHDPVAGSTARLTHDLRPATATTTGDERSHPLDATVVTERVFVRSGDDVHVPVFLVHRRDVTPSGAVPTVLWGYGGFSVAVTPDFRPAWRTWVAHGGLLAVACLRGGAEYGRAWADDGRLAVKQHVFDDALAVTRWLQGDGVAVGDPERPTATRMDGPAWTSPAHTGIEGRSNGGLLAGACLTQAPELFGSVVPEVGVLDLVRFHRFTIGWAWTSDYGDPDTPEGLSWVLGYSPLHRIEEGRAYPPTLVTTGDTDDRVVPSHSFKFAAALRHAQGGDAPVLLRVDRAAGHGAGKPTSQLLDERADVLAWHAHHLGLHVGP